MENKIKVIEFQKEYKMLTNKFKKEHPEAFNLGVIVAYTSEVQNGFMVKKQLRTTSKGTRFTYKPIKSREELSEYTDRVINRIKILDVGPEIEKMKEFLERGNKKNI